MTLRKEKIEEAVKLVLDEETVGEDLDEFMSLLTDHEIAEVGRRVCMQDRA